MRISLKISQTLVLCSKHLTLPIIQILAFDILIWKHRRFADPIRFFIHLFQNPGCYTFSGQEHPIPTWPCKGGGHRCLRAVIEKRDAEKGPFKLCYVLRCHKSAQSVELLKGGSTDNLNKDDGRFPLQSTFVLWRLKGACAKNQGPFEIIGDQKGKYQFHRIGDGLHSLLVLYLE